MNIVLNTNKSRAKYGSMLHISRYILLMYCNQNATMCHVVCAETLQSMINCV